MFWCSPYRYLYLSGERKQKVLEERFQALSKQVEVLTQKYVVSNEIYMSHLSHFGIRNKTLEEERKATVEKVWNVHNLHDHIYGEWQCHFLLRIHLDVIAQSFVGRSARSGEENTRVSHQREVSILPGFFVYSANIFSSAHLVEVSNHLTQERDELMHQLQQAAEKERSSSHQIQQVGISSICCFIWSHFTPARTKSNRADKGAWRLQEVSRFWLHMCFFHVTRFVKNSFIRCQWITCSTSAIAGEGTKLTSRYKKGDLSFR